MKSLKTVLIYICLFIILCISGCVKKTEQIYGLTIDDSWYESIRLEEVVLSLEKLRVKPTVRVVMSADTKPREYADLFERLHKVAYIMAEPVDSYEMNLYKDVESYKKRFEESKKYLGDYVDIWEIGNEVNGLDWIREDSEFIVEKIKAAYEAVDGDKAKVAITFYYENPEYNKDMFEWIRMYVPKDLMENTDYSLISYYEDDNEGYEPDWKEVFAEFEKLFPNAKIGIGECGNTASTADDESKISMIDKYYKMPKYTDNYIGGYFWWNYVKDCVGEGKEEVYKAVYNNFR